METKLHGVLGLAITIIALCFCSESLVVVTAS
jgi:hypothetical protein